MTTTADRPEHEVLIVGTGFAGMGMAIQLEKAGFHDFTVIEKGADVGGTWLVNDYPGCACDVPSHMYSFSFEPNPEWSREFASQPEILAYLRRCADKYGLRPHIQFNTQVVGAVYDAAACLWNVHLARTEDVARVMADHGLKPGDPLPSLSALPATRTVRARVVVSAMGGLSTPAIPKLKNLDRFQGRTCHSQQWDHGYDLRGKRVAVVGTGASAIQFVPKIQPTVAHLDIYQRTPPWVLPKADRAIPSPLRRLYRALPIARQARRLSIYTMLEGRAVALALEPRLVRVAEAYARLTLRRQVPDPVLRKKLTPAYALGCKRVLLTNDWFPAVTQPNVDVVTTGIAEVRERSIVDSEGVERPVDAIVFGTGFRVSDPIPRGGVVGRDGVDLAESWGSVPEAYKGTSVAGFPNLFLLVGPNVGLGHNSLVYMIESQIRYVVDAMRAMRRERLVEVEVERSAQDRFNVALQRRSARTVWTRGGCNSYYLDPKTGRNIAVWPGFTFHFRWVTRAFDATAYRLRPMPAGDARSARIRVASAGERTSADAETTGEVGVHRRVATPGE
jgi:cation diffusion facilitator CzcD-associated flavoprotein CzcO